MFPLRDSIPSRSWPIVNVLFIIINLAAFFHELKMPSLPALEQFIGIWGMVPVRFLAEPAAEWKTIFSSMFLHGSWGHIIGNMMYLWIFGDNVEDRMGHGRYLVFYLCVGTAAALAQTFLNPLSRVPMIGASGAIAGVLGAYFLLFPKSKVLALVPIFFFVRIVEVPALFFLGFWFILQAFQGLGSLTQQAVHGNVGGVAWWAHAGGFIAGAILVFIFAKSRRRR